MPRNLDALGLSERDASLLRRLGQTGQGVILAAGPTAEIAMGAAVTGHLVLSTIGSTWGANAANFA